MAHKARRRRPGIAVMWDAAEASNTLFGDVLASGRSIGAFSSKTGEAPTKKSQKMESNKLRWKFMVLFVVCCIVVSYHHPLNEPPPSGGSGGLSGGGVIKGGVMIIQIRYDETSKKIPSNL